MILATIAAFGLGVAGGIAWATHTAERIARRYRKM